jgi:hypothetical protein
VFFEVKSVFLSKSITPTPERTECQKERKEQIINSVQQLV